MARVRPTLLELAPRTLPSVYDLGGGVLHFAAGRELQPFSDYTGLLDTLTRADGTTVVVPSPFETERPGGPRVAEFDAAGNRTKPDYWAGSPDSRAGVLLVDTTGTATHAPLPPPPPVAPDTGVPALTYGDVANPSVWRVVLLYERPPSADWVRATTAAFWKLVEPLGNVAVTTVRPGDYPGNYGVVTVGADLSFTGDAGDTVARWDEPHSNWFDGGVYVDTRLDELGGRPQQPAVEAVVMAHEFGHALGLKHSAASPDNVMTFGAVSPDETFTPADVRAARAGAARAVALEYRDTTSEAAA